MNLSHLVIEWLANRLKIPPSAIRMFKAANALSGLDKNTLPTELIPLNSIQLARGVLNFAVLQSSLDWVLPFWAHQQFDPANVAFVPRSHIGLCINVTHRNWTAVGNPECPVEPVVDPHGLLTPFPNGWSVDIWLAVDGICTYPSRIDSVDQRLVSDLPVVETTFSASGVRVSVLSYTVKARLFHRVTISNPSAGTKKCRLALAVRPFNPEGISLIHDIVYRENPHRFEINNSHALLFSDRPDAVYCSTHERGDAADYLRLANAKDEYPSAHCGKGLANGFAAFDISLEETGERSVSCSCALDDGPIPADDLQPEEALRSWTQTLSSGMSLQCPDPAVEAAFRSSLATLLMLTDGPSITPGPFTYHQFWFRDATYMIWALDKTGFSRFTQPVIDSFPKRQDRSGYFRSQQGEWDSNGQVLWTVWQHCLLANDVKTSTDHFEWLHRAVQWIDNKRLRKPGDRAKSHYGMLPAGLSAEHLGFADYYFWDNFWSIGGLEGFIRLCELVGRPKEGAYARELLSIYRQDIENAIMHVRDQFGLEEIPATPSRPVDCGMIGTCCASYPLQLFPPADRRIIATLDTLCRRFSFEGMFFQHFVHSGMNPYLTLHIAHAYLYAGQRKQFWRLLASVLSHASSTLTFPEAIHPSTHGGSMGDGHHGWAAAEVVLALRDAYVYEAWKGIDSPHDLILLGGIPVDWFIPEKRFSCSSTPVPEGRISIEAVAHSDSVEIDIAFSRTGDIPYGNWILRLPYGVDAVKVNGLDYRTLTYDKGDTLVTLAAGAPSLHISAEAPDRRRAIRS